MLREKIHGKENQNTVSLNFAKRRKKLFPSVFLASKLRNLAKITQLLLNSVSSEYEILSTQIFIATLARFFKLSVNMLYA